MLLNCVDHRGVCADEAGREERCFCPWHVGVEVGCSSFPVACFSFSIRMISLLPSCSHVARAALEAAAAEAAGSISSAPLTPPLSFHSVFRVVSIIFYC